MLQPLRLLNARSKWFLRNYGKIRYDSQLFQSEHGSMKYNFDGLATSCNADFIQEPRFSHAYELAKQTNPWPNFTLMWRIHIACWVGETASHLEGDFVECGVNTGAYARAIIDFVDFNKTGKTFYLMDTFSGLDERYITDDERKLGIDNYKYRDTYEEVKKTFSPFKTKIIKGSIPDTLSQCDVDKICYLSIDMNNYIPEIAALEYFWPKVVGNGLVLLDDYGFEKHYHQKLAFDAFAEKVGHSILSLPTGQALIIKHS